MQHSFQIRVVKLSIEILRTCQLTMCGPLLSADPVARAQISAQTPCPSAPESCPCEHGLRAEYFFYWFVY